MIQATSVGRLSIDFQSPALHSMIVTGLMAAALFLPPTFVVAAPALLLVGVGLVRNSSTGVSRRLGWLSILSGSLVIALVAFVVVGLNGGWIIAR